MLPRRHRLLPAVLGCALALAGGCTGDHRTTAPPPPGTTGGGGELLEARDLPDGYTLSPPEAAPEVSAVSRVSIQGCDRLLDYFEGDAPAMVRFEAADTGPFVAEDISDKSELSQEAKRCASFTDTDADGTTTTVTVRPVTDFPRLGDAEDVFLMDASGGTGDDAFRLNGYLIVVRVGAKICTLVQYAQDQADRTEAETIARTAVKKLRQRQ